MLEGYKVIERKIKEAGEKIKEIFPQSFDTALILGSGLGAFSSQLENARVLDYREIPYFPSSNIQGHKGRLIGGSLKDSALKKPLLIMEGRFHYYEGHKMADIIFPIRVLGEIGIKTLIITNAAGGINSRFKAGQLMLIKDHINLMGENPLRGENSPAWGSRFPDLNPAYDLNLQALAKKAAQKLNISLEEGVYVALSGPNYETPAEIRFLEIIGGDAVGMSTVPEVIAARQMGLRVLGISCITNMAAGKSPEALSHKEVLKAGGKAQEEFIPLLKSIILEYEG